MLTPEQQQQAVRNLADAITNTLVGNDYIVVFEALLHTYMAAAKAQPALTQEAANAAMLASMRLAQHAANNPQHPIH